MITKLNKKDLLSIADLTKEEIELILNISDMIRIKHKNNELFVPLLGKCLAMIFRKPSTRTRVSFEIAMFQLGGASIYLSPNEIQLGRGETIADTARVLSRYVNGILIRTFSHQEVIEFAKNATVPVINGLTDFSHPCQVLSDLLTIKDKKKVLKGLTIAYVGDGNNVCNSWLFAAPKMEMNLRVASPKEYAPSKEVVEKSKSFAQVSKTQVLITESPEEAVKDADVIYTDVWTSMGQEEEAQKRKEIFKKYQVNSDLVYLAKKDVIVMHCLPAHRGEEITDDVMDGPHSVVFDQAENRLHAQKGILALLLNR
ncbi:MAG: ornithine carbamoyltransferase [Candidatus Goldbacteria bacterium]|nr:ornithine carbamoyltransferase [Candidatus Goldiibacteriota bacterium]